jgi:transcriptional regulator, abrB family
LDLQKVTLRRKNMKATGIIRRVDELGRVVIPIEIRNQFNIVEKDPIEIYVDDSSIILKKYEPNCVFCGNTNDLIEYKGKLVCEKCSKELNILHEKNK